MVTTNNLFFPCRTHRTHAHLQNGHNDSKQPDGAAEDFHDENLDEQTCVLSVRQGCPAAHDSDTDPAEEVGKADGEPGTEHGIT